ncbi:MAG: helix-turn-helix domain-containing protein [Oscillospiraceae bacterium]|nr:helix-turn-helix domain-containing protein [Oscillospiraceae bacterium]MDY3218357.1 helix-turn-helix domain-containing protein [Candidatus Fimivivens sp.]
MPEKFSDVGSRISSCLNSLCITQAELARRTGLSKNAINNYVKGDRQPDSQSLYTLSVCLGKTMEWLLTGEDRNVIIPPSPWQLTEEQARTASTYFPDLTEEQVALLNNFEKLDARDKREIKEIIRMKLGDTMGLSSSSEGHNGASGIA